MVEASVLEALLVGAERAAERCVGASEECRPEALTSALAELQALRAAVVTVEALGVTGGGKRLRKVVKALEAAPAACSPAASAARALLDHWMAAVTRATQPGQPGEAAEAGEAGEAAPAAKRAKVEAPSKGDPPSDAPPPVAAAKRAPPQLHNAARERHRELLTAALELAVTEGVPGDSAWVGAQVEAALYERFRAGEEPREYERTGGGSSREYKAKFRQLSFNLKDGNNTDLRRAVLLGEVEPQELLQLSSEELGSSARREANQKIREHAMWECERGQATQASTDAFQCGKCKQRKCTYFQMQTRSADEPMTTFVSCVTHGCGNRWKFC